MVTGILIALAVSVGWILVQNLWMHVRPATNRFQPMLLGYLFSLPALAFALLLVPIPSTTESPIMIWLQAGITHLLIFFCYVECFYHVERSVSLRLLVEIFEAGSDGVALDSMQAEYSLTDMIRNRLGVLCDRGFLTLDHGVYRLQPKGKLFAQAVAVASWLFQAKGQHERS